MKFGLKAFLIACPLAGLLIGWLLREFSHERALERSNAELYVSRDVSYDRNANISLAISDNKPNAFAEVAAACFSEDSEIDSETVEALLAMPNLKVVSFDRSTIDCDAFKRLHLSKSIALIGFGNTNVGDDELNSLAELESLKVVDVFQSAVTRKGIARFRAARPDVSVQNWYH